MHGVKVFFSACNLLFCFSTQLQLTFPDSYLCVTPFQFWFEVGACPIDWATLARMHLFFLSL